MLTILGRTSPSEEGRTSKVSGLPSDCVAGLVVCEGFWGASGVSRMRAGTPESTQASRLGAADLVEGVGLG